MGGDSVQASQSSASEGEETRAREIRVLRVTVSGVAGVVIVAIVAFFLALGGEKYMNGVLLLVPPERRPVAEDLLAGKLLWVLILYGGVQFVESNIITPRIQQSIASVPPVVLIASQLIMGVLRSRLGASAGPPNPFLPPVLSLESRLRPPGRPMERCVMERQSSAGDSVTGGGDRRVPEKVRWMARLGYAAKGTVYILVGALTAGAVLLGDGQITGSRGALSQLQDAAFGQIILAVIGLGLVAYVLWRFTQATWDPEEEGTDAKGILIRATMLISGFIYAGLAIYSFQLSFLSGGGGGGGGSGSSSTQSRTAELMSQPAGRILVGAVGLIVISYAIKEFYGAYTAKFMKKFRTADMNPDQRRWSERIGRMGHAARGVVFSVMGGFFLWAAWRSAPQEAMGLDGALETLAQQPYGVWILGAVAIGLACYGGYNWVEGRWREIGPNKSS